ncbi:type II toxin-antitoxin system PemK/MazF family toxin [uncultured Clostridium sp.]|uniref:type II toxin-antitoxin system PemK/MazF family toxin n=1 Tax=uncultured Clostridium sp. TaxID=59620 RepID=UPI0026377473|nr:type II toxin-antitoxin system PemK/MazF family toxin [uncultured Clostridium sp.]
MNKEFIIKRGMLFYADLGSCNSSVQGGLRPVIITGNNLQGKYGPIITVILITSKVAKKRLLTHTLLINEAGLNKGSISMAEQITTISKDKLVSCIGKLREKTMQEIDNTIDIALALTDVSEKEIKKQVEEVKRWENNVNDLKDIIPKLALEQIKLRYKIELNKLNKICNLNRKNINNYYIENISLFSSDMEVSTR